MIKKMHSKYILQELFLFITEHKKLKLIQNNSYLIKKLDLSIYDFKIFFFYTKINKYNCFDVNDYYEEFYKDFNSIIENKEELDELFYNCLSKSENFELNILDKNFDLMIDNPYFKKNISISMKGISNIKDLFLDNIPKLLLIKNNKLTEKAIKVFKDIFNIFSIDGTMNKNQGKSLLKSTLDIKDNEISKYIDFLFSRYDKDDDGLLSFEDIMNFFFTLINYDNNHFWKSLFSLGYNNLLEYKKEIDYNYFFNHPEEFEPGPYLNLMKISKEKIYKLSLFINVENKILQYFNNQQLFCNLKIIDISIYNLNQMFNLNLICPNIEELNLNINEIYSDNNNNDLNTIFPNMNNLNIMIKTKFNLFNLLKNLKNSKIENLRLNIIYFDDNYQIDSKIILEKIKNLEIKGYNVNDFLFHFFNNFELPFLQKYIINIDLNTISKKFSELNNNDYNIINQFIFNIVNNKDKFSLISFFSLPNQLKLIRHLQIDLNIFCFVYKRKRGKNYLFKFNINNKDRLKEYYSNLDFSIDINEIIKYKKIDIKGIRYKNEINIGEIIEKDDINLSDIYFNLNQKKYFINSFKNLNSIYCENEENILILKEFLNQKENFNNLKYINLNVNDISNYLNNIYNILSELIKSKKLKSLILRLPSESFNENIISLFKLIENSKKLRIINITKNSDNPKDYLNIEEILNLFPKLKKKINYFEEFKIGNDILIPKKKCYIIYEINNKMIGKNIQLLGNKNKEITKKCVLYLNNTKINNVNYTFLKKEYRFEIQFEESLINLSNMFSYCSYLTSLILSNFNINKVIDMSYMFSSCSLTSLYLSNFNSINVKNMSYMFYECSSLTSLNLSNFKTDNVINMSYMFFNCHSLKYINLYDFNTCNVNNMSYMFTNCHSLNVLNLSNFKTDKLINSTYMFYDCSSLIYLNLSNFNTINVTNMSFMFIGIKKNCKIISNDERILKEL